MKISYIVILLIEYVTRKRMEYFLNLSLIVGNLLMILLWGCGVQCAHYKSKTLQFMRYESNENAEDEIYYSWNNPKTKKILPSNGFIMLFTTLIIQFYFVPPDLSKLSFNSSKYLLPFFSDLLPSLKIHNPRYNPTPKIAIGLKFCFAGDEPWFCLGDEVKYLVVICIDRFVVHAMTKRFAFVFLINDDIGSTGGLQ